MPHSTMFPTLERRTPVTDNSHKAMSDEVLLGPVLWKRLQIALETRRSPEAIMKKAQDLITSVEATLCEVTGCNQGAFSHALDGMETPEGTLRKVMDGRRPAFQEVFNTAFWSRPVGDLTIRDDLEVLPVELREANFGVPTKPKAVP